MDSLFEKVKVLNFDDSVYRNIVSLSTSQNLYDDLSLDPNDWALAQRVEGETKPASFESQVPIIDRPFEEATWASIIEWPFKHWQSSRFSDGSFGVWYASATAQTTIYETVYHWYTGLLADAGFAKDGVAIERKIFKVNCKALLLDLRPACKKYPSLLANVYAQTQAIGKRIQGEGHPGLATMSARHKGALNVVTFTPAVLSAPKLSMQVRYLIDGKRVLIEKNQGKPWFEIQL